MGEEASVHALGPERRRLCLAQEMSWVASEVQSYASPIVPCPRPGAGLFSIKPNP